MHTVVPKEPIGEETDDRIYWRHIKDAKAKCRCRTQHAEILRVSHLALLPWIGVVSGATQRVQHNHRHTTDRQCKRTDITEIMTVCRYYQRSSWGNKRKRTAAVHAPAMAHPILYTWLFVMSLGRTDRNYLWVSH